MNNEFRKEGMNSCNCSKAAKKENDPTSKNGKKDISDHIQFAEFLCNSNQFDKFEIWFGDISMYSPSLLAELKKNEEFCFCVARLKFSQKKYEQVIKMLKSAPFSAKKEFVVLWENAHYKQKEEKIGKSLTPLQRFRLRKKNPPPTNICPFGRQIISPLFKEASVILKRWYDEHVNHPYPSVNEKKCLSRLTGLTLYQVKTWFANTRRRRKIHQLQPDPSRVALNNNKAHSTVDSKWLDENSYKGLYLSMKNLENQADLEDAKTVNGTDSSAVYLLEEADPDFRKSDVELQECGNSFLTSATDSTEIPPNLDCPDSSIYSFPVYTTPIEPSTSLGVLRPNHYNQLDEEIQIAKLRDISDSSIRSSQQASYLVPQNPTPCFTLSYSLGTLSCSTMDTSAGMVVCSYPTMPNNNLLPLVDNHLKPNLMSSNPMQPSPMGNDDFNQLARSCDNSTSTNHETSFTASTVNPPLGGGKDVMCRKIKRMTTKEMGRLDMRSYWYTTPDSWKTGPGLMSDRVLFSKM